MKMQEFEGIFPAIDWNSWVKMITTFLNLGMKSYEIHDNPASVTCASTCRKPTYSEEKIRYI